MLGCERVDEDGADVLAGLSASSNAIEALADICANGAGTSAEDEAVDCTPPNGVGAFVDIGGNAADPDAKEVVAAFPPPNGVGAVADIGGNAADPEAEAGAVA